MTMTIGDAVRAALVRNYSNFEGRASRPEYWWFVLAVTLVTLAALVIDDYLIGPPILESLVTLATIIPTFEVGARRLHDTDRSGWWQLLGALPLIGVIVLIVWWASPGTASVNRFGAPPIA